MTALDDSEDSETESGDSEVLRLTIEQVGGVIEVMRKLIGRVQLLEQEMESLHHERAQCQMLARELSSHGRLN